LPDRLALPAAVRDQRLVAVLRAPIADHVVAAARALYANGVACLEITLTTPGALDAIAALTAELGADAAIGAGTVLAPSDVRDAAAAGARYLLAPNLDDGVVGAALDRQLPIVPGAATPTEIAAAWRLGCSAVKIFPAASLGGPGFVRSVRDPLPGITLVPTGGVGLDDVRGYLDAGAMAVGVGTPLFGDTLTTGDISLIAERATKFAEAARS
jgi:2-dehydro-3-deoxyphosphogluconate aldolase/(4S)-4-hydroxy-2-oxoglutarate aldolase